MDDDIRLAAENLTLFIEPTFKRESIGFYSITKDYQYSPTDIEKASLVALKEQDKVSQGITEYEIPYHLEQLDLTLGYESYTDELDTPNTSHLRKWLESQKKLDHGIDVVCTHQIVKKVYQAPFTERTAMPWEVKLTCSTNGVCYLEEEVNSFIKYSEMALNGQKNFFRQQAFKKYITVKKGDHARHIPPKDRSSTYYRVNKLKVDSGVLVYPSEAHCFDMNYNAIDLRAFQEGRFDLPPSPTRLEWWSSGHLGGASTLLCGYYTQDESEANLTRLVTYDLKHIKPRIINNMKFDDEICTASLCTFVQFIKDLTESGLVSSLVIRFEPATKRLCVLDVVRCTNPIPIRIPSFTTQISSADETSSVEATPRTPIPPSNEAEIRVPKYVSIEPTKKETGLRLRTQPLNAKSGTASRTANEKVGTIQNAVKRKPDDHQSDEDINWFNLAIIFVFMAVACYGVPKILASYGARQ